MSARDEVLSRIRTAIGNAPGEGGEEGASDWAGAVPRDYRLRRDADPGELLNLLAGRLIDYKATVRRTTPSQLAAAIGEALTQRGARRVVVPPGLDLPALPAGVEAVARAGKCLAAASPSRGAAYRRPARAKSIVWAARGAVFRRVLLISRSCAAIFRRFGAGAPPSAHGEAQRRRRASRMFVPISNAAPSRRNAARRTLQSSPLCVARRRRRARQAGAG